MRFLAKTVLAVAVNGLALYAADKIIPGFSVSGDLKTFAIVALALTLLNWVVKPVLKLILGPIIILTLGLGLILVNMLILYILDSLTNNLTIDGILTLFYASIIIGAVNFFTHIAFKKK